MSAANSLRKHRWWLLVVAGCGALTFALRHYVVHVGAFPGDRWARTHLDGVGLAQPLVDLGFFFSVIGTPTIGVLAALVGAFFAARARGVAAAAFVLIAFSGVLVVAQIKQWSGPVPVWDTAHAFDALHFPSGHTAYAVLLFGALARVAWVADRRDIAWLLIAGVVAMGPFRVVAQTHLVSDVIAGYLVGLAGLILAALMTGQLPHLPARSR